MGKKRVKKFRHRTGSYEKAKVGQSFDWEEYIFRVRIRKAFHEMLDREERDEKDVPDNEQG